MVLTSPSAAQEALKPVKLITVQSTSSAISRQFFGQVVARETVDLAFQVGGQIVEFPVIEGDPLSKGSLIARLDLEPFELALAQARLEKEQADRNLARLQKLEGNTVAQVSVDDAKTQAGLAAIALRNAERSLEEATLYAPYDALVAVRDVANFTTISAGTPVVRLHDMSELRIEIDVPEILFQRAGKDPNVKVYASFPTSDRKFPLEVREFNAETSQVGQTFRLTFGLDLPDSMRVLPGSSVTVFATILEGKESIALPSSAVMIGNDGATSVMLYSGAETGTVMRRPVTLEAAQNGQFRVLDGLTPGEQVVAAGGNALHDGQNVRRFTGFPN